MKSKYVERALQELTESLTRARAEDRTDVVMRLLLRIVSIRRVLGTNADPADGQDWLGTHEEALRFRASYSQRLYERYQIYLFGLSFTTENL